MSTIWFFEYFSLPQSATLHGLLCQCITTYSSWIITKGFPSMLIKRCPQGTPTWKEGLLFGKYLIDCFLLTKVLLDLIDLRVIIRNTLLNKFLLHHRREPFLIEILLSHSVLRFWYWISTLRAVLRTVGTPLMRGVNGFKLVLLTEWYLGVWSIKLLLLVVSSSSCNLSGRGNTLCLLSLFDRPSLTWLRHKGLGLETLLFEVIKVILMFRPLLRHWESRGLMRLKGWSFRQLISIKDSLRSSCVTWLSSDWRSLSDLSLILNILLYLADLYI